MQRQRHADPERQRHVRHSSAGGARRGRDVQRRHGRRRQRDRAVRKHAAQRHAERAAGDREGRRLAQKQRSHARARDAKRAEHANLVAPREHRHGHRVVDEEQPDEERDVRERGQIEMKRREHLLDLPAALCRALHGQARAAVARRSPARRASIADGFGSRISTPIDAAEAVAAASCAAAMSISTKWPSSTRAGPSSLSSAADRQRHRRSPAITANVEPTPRPRGVANFAARMTDDGSSAARATRGRSRSSASDSISG